MATIGPSVETNEQSQFKQNLAIQAIMAYINTGVLTARNLTLSPAAGETALTLDMPGTFAYGIAQQQAVSGALSAGQFFLNYLIVTDTADASSTTVNGLYGHYVDYTVGGSTVLGSRAAIRGAVTLNGATNAANTNRFYLGAFLTGTAATGDGGTNTGAGALGYVSGANIAAITSAAASNLETVVGVEINTNLFAGTTLRSRFGAAIGPTGGGSGQGAVNDAGLYFFAVGGTSGWQDALHFDGAVSQPVSATGNILRASGAYTIGSAFDLSGIAITNWLIRGPSDNFRVSGTGFAEMLEQVAPSAGAANTVRIYAQDNGGGKTQLMALFNSGAAQQIAIQP